MGDDQPTKPAPPPDPSTPTVVAGVAAEALAAAERLRLRTDHDLPKPPQVLGREAIADAVLRAHVRAAEGIALETHRVLNAVGLALYQEGLERGKTIARDVTASYLAALETRIGAIVAAAGVTAGFALPRPTVEAVADELRRRRLPIGKRDVNDLCCQLGLPVDG